MLFCSQYLQTDLSQSQDVVMAKNRPRQAKKYITDYFGLWLLKFTDGLTYVRVLYISFYALEPHN